jgi:hypothetical protein
MEEDVETCEHSFECELRDDAHAHDYDCDDDYDELHGSVDGNDVLLLLHIRVSVSRW